MIPEQGTEQEMKEGLLRCLDFTPQKGRYLFKKPGVHRWRELLVQAPYKTYHVELGRKKSRRKLTGLVVRYDFFWGDYFGKTEILTLPEWHCLYSQGRLVRLVPHEGKWWVEPGAKLFGRSMEGFGGRIMKTGRIWAKCGSPKLEWFTACR